MVPNSLETLLFFFVIIKESRGDGWENLRFFSIQFDYELLKFGITGFVFRIRNMEKWDTTDQFRKPKSIF